MKSVWSGVPDSHWEQARKMRWHPSPPEQRLWDALKEHRAGSHFRRQHPIGIYIVDFCAPRKHLIIEVDGATHDDETVRVYDAERDEVLREQGYRILRFSASDVMNKLDVVLAVIRKDLTP